MEFTNIGAHCHYDLCGTQTYLPLECRYCNHQFCESHIDENNHECQQNIDNCLQETQIKECEEKFKQLELKQKKIHHGHKCNYKSCKKYEFVPIVCKRCKLSFCVNHRLDDDHNCDGPKIKKKVQGPKPAKGKQKSNENKFGNMNARFRRNQKRKQNNNQKKRRRYKNKNNKQNNRNNPILTITM